MNIWKKICQQVAGVKRGLEVYRQTVDAGKVVAPVAAPLVQAILTQAGLPTTPEAALSVLVGKALLESPPPPSVPYFLPADLAALQNYVAAHLPPSR